MTAEMEVVCVAVIAVVALTAAALNRFEEVIAAATNCLRCWNGLQETYLSGLSIGFAVHN